MECIYVYISVLSWNVLKYDISVNTHVIFAKFLPRYFYMKWAKWALWLFFLQTRYLHAQKKNPNRDNNLLADLRVHVKQRYLSLLQHMPSIETK